MSGIGLIALLIVAALAALIVMGIVLTRMYKRASKECSFVRTGVGGQKVVINGGALVLPVLHEIIRINMNTLKLTVQKKSEEALITKDKMRIDVTADFYLRVKPDADAIASAAQTLGKKTMNPQELKTLLDGKFVDALRAVAAEMMMEELYEKRPDFVQKVQKAVAEDLMKNGMELETVSLTSLDQTDMKFFNPNNAFDAVGLTKLTEIVQSRRKLRNDIEQTTDIEIKNKNLDAEKQRLEISKQEAFYKATQVQEVAVQAAQRQAETAKQQADQTRIAQEASITAQQSIQITKVDADKKVQQQTIANEQAVETSRITKDKAIELANQDRNIAISQKSEEQSKAKTLADTALAISKAQEEKVTTAKETEIASRKKAIAVIAAEQDAQQKAVEVRVAAEAKKDAAVNEAAAITTVADAKERNYEVDAEGKRKINEAENKLSDEMISMRVKLATIDKLPQIIAESVKPMEAIDSIKLINVTGLGNNGGNGSTVVNNGNGNFAETLVDSLLKYRTQAPIIDSILKEVGIDASSLQGMTKSLQVAAAPTAPTAPAAPASAPTAEKGKKQ